MFFCLLGGYKFLKLEIEQNNLKIFNMWQQIWYYDGKIPCTIGSQMFSLKCGFGIGYGFGQKYRAI